MEKTDAKTTHNYMVDFLITDSLKVSSDVVLLSMTPADCDVALRNMDIRPGQFVQVKTPDNATFLRRPISICFIDGKANKLLLLVRDAGNGSRAIMHSPVGSKLNIILPLGNGFSAIKSGSSPLLIGGGVGVAPLLMLGAYLKQSGVTPTFLIGAKTRDAILLANELSQYGHTCISTDDGSFGEKGLVTQNHILEKEFSSIYCCGPLPMMKAVAKIAKQKDIFCEVSLENVMGCGIGACLCCVEKTVKGNLCVCKDGPVFNINQLLWHN